MNFPICSPRLLRGLVAASLAWPAAAEAFADDDSSRSFVNSLDMTFVRIPAGEFWMGAAEDDANAEADERPRHRVRVTRAFAIGAYEVTQAEYEAVVGANPSWFSPQGPGGEALDGVDWRRLPVDFVTWDEAMEFCRLLSELPDEKRFQRRYRLPTEAEWEYSARAGSETRYPFGDDPSTSFAHMNAGERGLDGRRAGRPAPVGSYPPNAFGLYDVCGNVWEWSQDRYAADYYAVSPTDDPAGPAEGTGRVVRGGDWFHTARYCRVSHRDFTRASRRDLGNGFRVVCELEP